MKNKFLSSIFILLSLFIFSCSGSNGAKLRYPVITKGQLSDTLTNDLQCSIIINGKDYTIPPDSITTAYTFSDSSLILTFKGVGSGRLVFTIPNIFKCPSPIATGYSSVRFKVAGSDEYSVEPTVDLYDYGMRGISFNNLNDGQHKNEASPGAADIISIQKIDENTTTNWAAYLVKGKIHTTVLKNVYESAAGEMNRDYTVNGSFVIHAKIYF